MIVMHSEITRLTPEKRNKTYSFRDPKSPISETDESEPSHTLINYESEDSDMVESKTGTGSSNASFVTKKLKMPTPYSGKRDDL